MRRKRRAKHGWADRRHVVELNGLDSEATACAYLYRLIVQNGRSPASSRDTHHLAN